MARMALIVGINSYGGANNLHACVADARAMAEVLTRHDDQEREKNFDCIEFFDLTDAGAPITRPELRAALSRLFKFDGDVLFYFSGHGFLSETGGLLCTSDATKDDWGIPMQEVMDRANRSKARHILLILDCCHSGDIANPATMNGGGNPLAVIRENMTVIAASRATEEAIEAGGHGLFTAALLDGLKGAAADHLGFVTAPALYAHVSRRFRARDQRPVYKTNETEVFTVRECEPWILRRLLRQLPNYFEDPHAKIRLDPDYDPEDEHGNITGPVDQAKVAAMRVFRSYRDAGLLKSSDSTLELWKVTRSRGTVELTPLGREYWWLVAKKVI